MSDRPERDAWDFGEDEAAVDEPYDDGAWEEELPAGGGGGYERSGAGGPPRGALLTALAVMVVLALGIAAAVLADDDDDGDREDAASELDTNDRSTSSSSSTTSTTAGAGAGDTTPTIGPGSSSTTTPRVTSTTRRGATTTTVAEPLADPDCETWEGQTEPVPADWAERWQTMPQPNKPAMVTICIDDTTPKVGQTVVVTLQGDDPDAVIVEQECGWRILLEGDEPNTCRDYLTPHDGPRPTPPPELGYVLVRRTHVYGTPGTRTIVGTVQSSRYEGYTSPYASSARAGLPIVVHP